MVGKYEELLKIDKTIFSKSGAPIDYDMSKYSWFE